MNCPICNVPLNIAERQGVEIDYCPQCRGVWLDRGELDKIIERLASEIPSRPYPERRDERYDQRYDRHHNDHHHDHNHDHHKKKRGLLDIFDFD